MKRSLTTLALIAAVFVVDAQMGTPIPKELEGVKFMTGKWSGDLTMSFMGNESKSKSTMDAKMGVGGRWLVSDHTYEMDGMTMHGSQMLTFDAQKKKWISWWFDSAEAGSMEMEGTLDSKGTLSLVSKPTVMAGSDQPIVMRAVYKKVSNAKFDFSLDMKQGDTWAPMMSGSYTKEK